MLVHRVLYAFALCLLPVGRLAEAHAINSRAVDPLARTSECAVCTLKCIELNGH
jgi:hypothetical protein